MTSVPCHLSTAEGGDASGVAVAIEAKGNPNVRSHNEVSGYRIAALYDYYGRPFYWD